MSAILSNAGSRLRPLNADDLEDVMFIEQRAYQFPWTKSIFRDCLRVGYNCWCYDSAGVIEGYGVMSVAAGESHILNLTVRPESQRRGIGSKMMCHFLQLARRHDADLVMLEVRPSNHAAVALYLKCGFNEIGVRRGYYPTEIGREDALILARSLS